MWKLDVPDPPIGRFIEGDGTGPDIRRASQAVFDAVAAQVGGTEGETLVRTSGFGRAIITDV